MIVFMVKGRVREVDFDKQVRGAFGFEPAILVRVEREPGKDFTDNVFIPDTPANRKIVIAGYEFLSPCIIEATQYQGGKPYIVTRANFQA